ncbi:MAG TPA: hypothetical protein VLZ84_08265, partial [Asticcacaulis sp.]|nr:hypothetical protein [Asticcacaulis sp.]
QRGIVSMPSRSGHIFLIINAYGQYDLTVLSPPGATGRLYGLNAGLANIRGAPVPGSGAVVLVPFAQDAPPAFPFGTIDRSGKAYDHCARLLADAEANIATTQGVQSYL